MAIITRKISRQTTEQKPYEAWNAFINILAVEKYDDLTSIQRIAHLCFWYDSEVQNGGHLQFFENRGTSQLDETLSALTELHADCQLVLLKQAIDLLEDWDKPEIKSVQDYVEAARSGTFDEVDLAYYSCRPTIQQHLSNYLQQHMSHFIEIV